MVARPGAGRWSGGRGRSDANAAPRGASIRPGRPASVPSRNPARPRPAAPLRPRPASDNGPLRKPARLFMRRTFCMTRLAGPGEAEAPGFIDDSAAGPAAPVCNMHERVHASASATCPGPTGFRPEPAPRPDVVRNMRACKRVHNRARSTSGRPGSLREYQILVTFEDGKIGGVDLRHELWGKCLSRYGTSGRFRRFRFDPDLDTIVFGRPAPTWPRSTCTRTPPPGDGRPDAEPAGDSPFRGFGASLDSFLAAPAGGAGTPPAPSVVDERSGTVKTIGS